MTLKLSNILEINNLLKDIIDEESLNIDALLKFKLLGIMKNLESSVNNFEIIRNDKIREYGKEITDENGSTSIAIDKDDKESVQNFINEINKIADSEVEINIHKLKPSDVFDKGLPAKYLVGLYNIIEE